VNNSDIRFGLPPAEQLERYRIWDSYFLPTAGHGTDAIGQLMADIERTLPAIHKGCFEMLCFFPHVGIGTTTDVAFEQAVRNDEQLVLAPLERWPQMLLGMIQLNPHDVPASLEALDRWLGEGQMVGVYFAGGGPAALTCTHASFDPLIDRIEKLGGIIMQHTWFKTGGKQGTGESTPTELAELAARFPQQKFLCAHAGGEWERGLRAVANSPNVLVETSGFDATAGFIEMAVRAIGAERIVFGSHLPSRSLGTELSKITAADISETEKRRILGGTFRRLLRPILQRQGREEILGTDAGC
jgi:uncharacterized protein